MKKILLLGSTGKMGTAIRRVFKDEYEIVEKSSKDFNAYNYKYMDKMIEETEPDIVINCVAKLGIKQCEEDFGRAFSLNTIYPRELARLSNKYNFLLVHFSTDAVFNNHTKGYITESTIPTPMNIYGVTKYGADCFIQNIAERYYIIRLPLLFGPVSKPFKESSQYVENILYRIKEGEKELRIAEDVTFSPGYTIDICNCLKEIIETEGPYGLYHLANSGYASLYEFTKALVNNLNLDVKVIPTTIKEFYHDKSRNQIYPMKSEMINDLRSWVKALEEYCKELK